MDILRTYQEAEWMSVLSSARQYDFYHLPSYHALAEKRGEGVAELFVHRDQHCLIAIPLLIRVISEVPGLERLGSGLKDATSVYGYAGPLASDWNPSDQVIKTFQIELREALQRRRVVSLFSRLHPLFPQQSLLFGLGLCKSEGHTISIDLTQSRKAQIDQYRDSHKRGIRKLLALDVQCFCDPDYRYLDDFMRIYHETMNRVHSSHYYLFPKAYFEYLRDVYKDNIRLFVCRYQGETICAATFVLCNGIVQGHLGGTRSEFIRLSPMKLLLDTVREWGNTVGARIFHIGGGVGSREDSLFRFKEGFSRTRHEFITWRWVLSEYEYQRLCAQVVGTIVKDAATPERLDFFPTYRAGNTNRQPGATDLV